MFLLKLLLVAGSVATTSQQEASDQGRFLFPEECAIPTPEIVIKVLLGENVNHGEMPWMVKLQIFNGSLSNPSLCTGFLISRKWVMTAAHCLENEIVQVTVSAGRTNYSQETASEVVLNVTQGNFFVHPEYDASSTYKRHDIALIRLPISLASSNNIRPICLMADTDCQDARFKAKEFENCRNLTSAGWGATERSRSSDVLRKVQLTTVGRRRCSRSYEGFNVELSEICAIGQGTTVLGSQTVYGDTCRGDSGGPLMCNVNGTNIAIGITSFGKGCGLGNPGVYTRVCYYKDWIRDKVNEEHGCQVPRHSNVTFTNMANGMSVSQGTHVRPTTRISLTCHHNFNPNTSAGSIESTCESSGEWSSRLAECVANEIYCSQLLPNVPNGDIVTSLYTQGSVALIRCKKNFTLSGDENFVKCLSNGQWSAPNANCVSSLPPPLERCGTLPTVQNGAILPGDNTIGSIREISCFKNYTINGSPDLFCQNNLNWTEPGRCEPDSCGDVPQVSAGYFSSGDNLVGTIRQLFCNPGFERTGDDTIVCQQNRIWSTPGICSQVPTCGSIPNVPNAQFSGGNFTVGSTRQMQCEPNFSLDEPRFIVCLDSGNWTTPGKCIPGNFPNNNVF